MGSETGTLTGMGTQVGDLLGGKYVLEAELGSGGMGVVYRARNVKLNLPVAVKVLHDELAKRPGFVARFLREARAATMVRHPNVVEVLDVDAASGVPYIVMELLEGVSLAEYHTTKGGLLSVADVLEFLGPVMEALGEAHEKGVVHRDLKPDNVFLSSERERLVPKLLDFGISAIRNDDQRVTVTGNTLGTPRYMAPEQVRLTRDADARSDVWSLGIMMYELLSGTHPFDGESAGAIYVAIATHEPPPLEKIVRDIPRSVSRIVARCMRRDPAERYTSTRHLLRDLQLAQLDDEIAPISSPPPVVPDLELPGAASGPPRSPVPRASPMPPAPPLGLEVPSLGLPPSHPSVRMAAVAPASSPRGSGGVPDLGPVRHSSGQIPAAVPSSSSPARISAHGPAASPVPPPPSGARRNMEIELEAAPESLRQIQPRSAVAYGRQLRGEPPAREFNHRSHDGGGSGVVPTLVVGFFSAASGAGLFRRLHEPEGWPVVSNLAPETYPGSVQAIVGGTIGAAGLASALLGLREKQMTVALGGAGALLLGALVGGEVLDLTFSRYGGLGLAIIVLAIWARIVFEGRRMWSRDSIVAKGAAIVIGLVAGGALFATVELVFGVLG